MTCTVSEMIEKFDVQPGDSYSCELQALSGGSGVVDGHQLLAQILVAATRLGRGQQVRSVHLQFCRVVRDIMPARLDLQPYHDGKSFSGMTAVVRQRDVVCAQGQVLLAESVADFIAHSQTGPVIAQPDDATEVPMPVVGREVRLVEDTDLMDPHAPVGLPQLNTWLRYDKEALEQCLEQALLAHFTGHLGIATTLRAHPGLSQIQAHREFMSGILSIDLAIHNPVDASQWMLYQQSSIFAGAGLSYIRGQVFTSEGILLASFNQHAMIRAMPERLNSDSTAAEKPKL